MKKSLLLFIAVSFCFLQLKAQQFSKAVDHAYLITRMAEKFHFHPRPVNDRFSADLYNQFLNALDGEKIFFTVADINLLDHYKYLLDDQIKNKQSQFLQTISVIYQKRLTEVQRMINEISKTPFDFTFNEKLSVAEDTSFPANATAQHSKIYKTLKLAVLNGLIKNNNDLSSLDPAQQKKYLKEAEPEIRAKIKNAFTRSISRMINGSGGFEKMLGDEYCKTIALCYDPHTEYLPVAAKEQLETELGDKNMILGFTLKADAKGNIFINSLIPGSPAYKSGQINKGDRILMIQWEGSAPVDISGATVKEINDVLNANNQKKVTLTLRKADGTKRNVVLTKEAMDDTEENKVKGFLLKGNKTIGYISLPAFYEDWESEKGINGSANDVAKEIVKLKKENIDGLIIDVRYNEGGSMQEAIEMAGIFIDAGPVAQQKTRDGNITLKDVNKGTIYDGPLLLLVNGYSASASEMIAATLQDYNRAVIAGSPTYGKATTQLLLPLDTTITKGSELNGKGSEGYIKITTGEIYRLTGKSIQGVGVMPDILIPDIYPQKESSNTFALSAPAIAANKYYQPYPKNLFIKYTDQAKKEIASSPFFKKLQQYVLEQNKPETKKDVSLRLADALALQKATFSKPVSSFDNKSFTVENHNYENERLQSNKTLKEVNEDWRKHLSQDEYIKIAYDIMNDMIQ